MMLRGLALLIYAWLGHPPGETIEARFVPPPGAARVPVAAGSFGAWLRGLPLLPPGAPVHLFDGSIKPRQDVHAAVVDLDVGARDLQQCADAVMRLRAEFDYANARPIAFHPDPGRPKTLRYAGPFGSAGRAAFTKYLIRVMADAGTASLAAELHPAPAIEPGDVLIQGGYPGHAVLVLDVAATADGKRFLLLGQSYMPAQQFHVLRNGETPWFDATFPIQTPEWRPFRAQDLHRF